MKRTRKIIITCLTLILLVFNAYGSVNAMSYTYDFWKNIIPSTEGLAYRETYYSNTILDEFGEETNLVLDTLTDFSVYEGNIYLLDSRKTYNKQMSFADLAPGATTAVASVSSLIILNQNFQFVKELDEFEMTDAVKEKLEKYYGFTTPLNEITSAQYTAQEVPDKAPYSASSTDPNKAVLRLDEAQGVEVTSEGIFIADTENSRILKLNSEYVCVDVYLTPADSAFTQYNKEGIEFEEDETAIPFKPLKVTSVSDGSIYCISRDIYEGIIEFNLDTEFNRFLGTNTVVANPLKKFWAKLFSEAQLSTMELDLPPMFTNICADEKGFIYATSKPDADDTAASKVVKAINKSGKDVMRRNGYVLPDGDVVYLSTSNVKDAVTGASSIIDVAISSTGNFTIADANRGRIFTYDIEGNLLYIAGEQPGGQGNSGSGGLSNSILNPSAINYLYRTNEDGSSEELLLVLDQKSSSIIVYETTEFGETVNTATYLYQNGMIEEAEEYWRKAEKMNTNYELAYLGIGKSLLRQGRYEEAMEYFKKAHNGTYYSKAFSNYRDNVLKENFSWIMTVAIIGVVGIFVYKYIKYVNKKRNSVPQGGDE